MLVTVSYRVPGGRPRRVHGDDAPRRARPPAQRRRAVGPVPRPRRHRPLPRDVRRRDVGRAPPPARPADPHGRRDDAAGPGVRRGRHRGGPPDLGLQRGRSDAGRDDRGAPDHRRGRRRAGPRAPGRAGVRSGVNTIAAIEAGPERRGSRSSGWSRPCSAVGLAARSASSPADSEFFYSDLSTLFLQSDWPTIAALDLPSGGAAYPLSTPGARLMVRPTTKEMTVLVAL